jgi:hypothetical protein
LVAIAPVLPLCIAALLAHTFIFICMSVFTRCAVPLQVITCFALQGQFTAVLLQIILLNWFPNGNGAQHLKWCVGLLCQLVMLCILMALSVGNALFTG